MKSPILLVDDEVNVLSALSRALMDEPFEIVTAQSGEEALRLLERQRFKLIISDERMSGMQGSELLAIVRDKYPETVRMLLTGHATLESALKAVNQGEIYRFFTKPWDNLELKFAICSALENMILKLKTAVCWPQSKARPWSLNCLRSATQE